MTRRARGLVVTLLLSLGLAQAQGQGVADGPSVVPASGPFTYDIPADLLGADVPAEAPLPYADGEDNGGAASSSYNPVPCALYTVRAGDTCWGLSLDRLLPYETLERQNPGLDCNAGLKVGAQLCLPPIPDGMTNIHCTSYDLLLEDESCWLIAARAQITIEQLLGINPGLDCNNLAVGEPLCVADTKIAPAPAMTHYCTNIVITTPEDTCESLAGAGSTTIDRLKEINRDLDCEAIDAFSDEGICVEAVSVAKEVDLLNENNPARMKSIQTLAMAIGQAAHPEVMGEVNTFTNNPTPANEDSLLEDLRDLVIADAGLAARIEKDPAVMEIAKELTPFGADEMCAELKNGSYGEDYAAARDCFCSLQPGQGLLRCEALLSRQLEADVGAAPAPGAGPAFAPEATEAFPAGVAPSSSADVEAAGRRLQAAAEEALSLRGSMQFPHGRDLLACESPLKRPFSSSNLGWLKSAAKNAGPCTLETPDLGLGCGMKPDQSNRQKAVGVVKQALKEGLKARGLPSLCFGAECCFLISAAPVLDVCVGAKLCSPPISFGSLDGLSNICIGSTSTNPLSSQTCAPISEVVSGLTAFQLQEFLDGGALTADLNLCVTEKLTKPIPFLPKICFANAGIKYLYLQGMIAGNAGIDAKLFKAGVSAHLKMHPGPLQDAVCQNKDLKCSDMCTMSSGNFYFQQSIQYANPWKFKYVHINGSPWEQRKNQCRA